MPEARTAAPGGIEPDLDDLCEVVDELQRIAESDAQYSEYAENFLAALEEAGHDV